MNTGILQREIIIETKVTDWALKNNWLVEKVKFSSAGYPDRIYFGYGLVVLIEFKRPGLEPEPLQRHRIDELRKHGILATWADTFERAVGILTRAMDSARVSNRSHQTAFESGQRRSISRPGSGEDFYLSCSVKDLKNKRLRQEVTYSGSPAPLLQSVAGRDKEVGGLPGSVLHGAARKKKTGKTRKQR